MDPAIPACLAGLSALGAAGWLLERARRRLLEREKAGLEEDCRRKTRRLAALVDETSDLVLRYSSDGRVREIDERGLRLLGLVPQDVSRLQLRELFAPSHLPLVALSSVDFESGREHWGPLELVAIDSSGQECWLLARIRRVDEDDDVAEFELVGSSIEAQKRAERTSAQGADLLQELARVTSTEGGLADALEVVCRQLGYDDAELWMLDAQFDVLRLAERWNGGGLSSAPENAGPRTVGKGSSLEGQTWAAGRPILVAEPEGDGRSARAAGDPHASGLGFPVRLAGHLVGVAALRAVQPVVRMPSLELLGLLGAQLGQFAQRLSAEERLRSSEARNRAILECTIEGVVTTDGQGAIIDFNPAAERILGYARSDVLGRPVVDVVVPSDLRGDELDVFSRYLAADERPSAARVETRGLRADGSEVEIEVAITPLVIDGGSVLTAFLRDISHRKEVERLKDELVSTVSHELRTPLASVRGFVELLLMRDYPVAEQKKFLGIVDTELKRLNRLIDDFLDLQRMESGLQMYDADRHDLCEVIRGCLEVAAGTGERHRFRLDLPGQPVVACFDLDRIQQVVMNLVSNAVKFSPDGGEICVSVRERADRVEISVRDSGLGMAPETVDKLFSKFYRADNGATRRIQGTGLGLALVREIVTAHGGEVRVESEPGVGSLFIFTLPREVADGLKVTQLEPA